MSSDLHGDFLRIPEGARWKGRLDALWATLSREAGASKVSIEDVRADRGWYWRMLPHGAVVGLRRRPDIGPASGGRFELRIARSGELAPENVSRWESEVATFLKHFSIRAVDGTEPAIMPLGSWLRLPPSERDEGKTVVRFLSLMMGEVKPGRARCADCAAQDPPVITEIDWFPSFGVMGQACNACAMARGRKDRLARAGAGGAR